MEPAFLSFYTGFDDDAYWRLPYGRWARLVGHMHAVKQREAEVIAGIRG